jgi:hypothetical protein
MLLLHWKPVKRRRRQWDGPTGMSSWGGPQPGPECRSCFKDGISFAPNEAPRGFQTPEFNSRIDGSVFNRNWNSFFDAAIVFTDTDIRGLAGRPAVVVLFRWAATLLLLQDTVHSLRLTVETSKQMLDFRS